MLKSRFVSARGRDNQHCFTYRSLTCQRGLIQGSWLERGRGSRPRIWSEAFSPAMIDGAVEIAIGNPREDRAIRNAKSFDADDAALRIDHRHRIICRAHLAGAAGVESAFRMFAQEIIDLLIRSAHGYPAKSRGRDRDRAPPGRKSRASIVRHGGNPPSHRDATCN